MYWTSLTGPPHIHPDMEDRWLSVEEIAHHLGVQPDTVYKWITRKKMPVHRVGRLLKFKPAEIDLWVLSGAAENKISSNDET
jgi:excisionase family DNA binding protein